MLTKENSPAHHVLVLLIDRYPFDGFISQDDAKREGGRLNESGREAFEEHPELLLAPELGRRSAERVEPLNLQARPDDVEWVCNYCRREASKASGHTLYEKMRHVGDNFD